MRQAVRSAWTVVPPAVESAGNTQCCYARPRSSVCRPARLAVAPRRLAGGHGEATPPTQMRGRSPSDGSRSASGKARVSGPPLAPTSVDCSRATAPLEVGVSTEGQERVIPLDVGSVHEPSISAGLLLQDDCSAFLTFNTVREELDG